MLPDLRGLKMTETEIESYVATKKCKRCGNPMCVSWSPCYDQGCCGIMDRIDCEVCDTDWEFEGYFRGLGPEEIDELLGITNE